MSLKFGCLSGLDFGGHYTYYQKKYHHHFIKELSGLLNPATVTEWKPLFKIAWDLYYGELPPVEIRLLTAVKSGDLESLKNNIKQYQGDDWRLIKQGNGDSLIDCAALSADENIMRFIYNSEEKSVASRDPAWAARCRQDDILLTYIGNSPFNNRYLALLKTILHYYTSYRSQDILSALYNIFKTYISQGYIKNLTNTLAELHQNHHCLTTLRVAALCNQIEVIQEITTADLLPALYEFICPVFSKEPTLLAYSSQTVRDYVFQICRQLANNNDIVSLQYKDHSTIELSLFQVAMLCQQKKFVIDHHLKHTSDLSGASELFARYYHDEKLAPAYLNYLMTHPQRSESKPIISQCVIL